MVPKGIGKLDLPSPASHALPVGQGVPPNVPLHPRRSHDAERRATLTHFRQSVTRSVHGWPSHEDGSMKRLDAVWFVVFFGFSSFWILTAAGRVGRRSTNHPSSWDSNLEHRPSPQRALGTMPLPMDVAMLRSRSSSRRRLNSTRDGCSSPGTCSSSGNTPDSPASWKQLGAPGRLAMAFLACEPTFLAHAALLTTDIAVTALVADALGLRGRGMWRHARVPAVSRGPCARRRRSSSLRRD